MWSRKAEDFVILMFTKDLLFGLMLKIKLERIFNAGISLNVGKSVILLLHLCE